MSAPELSLGMGGHHRPNRGEKDEWLTPPAIIEALGPFDLDPCSPINRPWPTAAIHLTLDDDGLTTPWDPDAFVWLNPPYGPETWAWLDRLAEHPGGGIALIFARTETAGFFRSVWRQPAVTALIFIEGRLYFHHVTGERAAANSGAPSVLIAFGSEARRRLADWSAAGEFVDRSVRQWADATKEDDRG